MKNVIKYMLSLLFAGGLMYWTLKDYNFAENFEKLKNAKLSWIFVSGLFSSLAHISRGMRSKMLLEPIGYKTSTLNGILAIFLGYFANYLVPRLGEVTRCTSLQSTDNVPFQKTFGTVVLERVIDIVILLSLLLLNFVLEFDRLSGYFISFFDGKFNGNLYPLIFIGLFLIAALYISFQYWKKNSERILKNKFVAKIAEIIAGIVEGLTSIRKLKNPGLFIFHSLAIWVCYFLGTYVLFFALPETSNLGLLAGLSTLVMGAIGIAAPTPGGLGTYHALVGGLMVLYGLSAENGKTLAIFMHGSQMIITIITGLLAMIILFFVKKKNLTASSIL